MSGQVDASVLRRMVSADVKTTQEVPVTASRAMRLALTRAAESTVGLQLTVQSVSEEVINLEGVQDALDNDALLLKLMVDGGLAGVIALDRALIAAIVEVQTTGAVSAIAPEPRAVTVTDLMLVEPLLDGLFAQLTETTAGTVLDGWTAGVISSGRFDDIRAIGLALEHITYRAMRMNVDLGAGERHGEMVLALPAADVAAPKDTATPARANWAAEMAETVMQSPAALTAVLHRFDLPLQVATALVEGQVLPLPGCTVNSVHLVGPDGVRVAKAKLGQVAGHVAVRLEDPLAPTMKNLAPQTASAPVPEQLVLSGQED